MIRAKFTSQGEAGCTPAPGYFLSEARLGQARPGRTQRKGHAHRATTLGASRWPTPSQGRGLGLLENISGCLANAVVLVEFWPPSPWLRRLRVKGQPLPGLGRLLPRQCRSLAFVVFVGCVLRDAGNPTLPFNWISALHVQWSTFIFRMSPDSLRFRFSHVQCDVLFLTV